MSTKRCCVTIKPQWVTQTGRGAGGVNAYSNWSPVLLPLATGGIPGSADGHLGFRRNFNTAFGILNHLSAYPDELKQECFSIGKDDFASFEIDADLFDDDINCQDDYVGNQQVELRYHIETCGPAGLHFEVQGRVERKDIHFDFIAIRIRELGAETWETILYEHGTGEGIDCLMAERICCGVSELAAGKKYELDILIATGDGQHHEDFEWKLVWWIGCTGIPTCEDACSGGDPPGTPPEHPDDPNAQPPYGQGPPGVGQPPTPGYRGDCMCDNCTLIGIGVEIERLVNSSYDEPGGCVNVEFRNLISALNGGYILSDHGGSWYQELGSLGDIDDMGVLVATQKHFCHNTHPACVNHAMGDQGLCVESEIYCWKVSGSLTCIDCELGEGELAQPGVKWSGTVNFHFQCRARNLPGDWFIHDCSSVGYEACSNTVFDQLEEQICEVPPGCNGEVKYNNGANIIIDPEVGGCIIGGSVATATLTPIGTTHLCTAA